MRRRLQLTVCKSQQGNSQVKSSGENQGPQPNKTVSFRGTPEPPQNTAALVKPQRPCGTPELSSQGKASAEPGWRLAEASPQEERRLPRGRADNISNRENTGLCLLPHGLLGTGVILLWLKEARGRAIVESHWGTQLVQRVTLL